MKGDGTERGTWQIEQDASVDHIQQRGAAITLPLCSLKYYCLAATALRDQDSLFHAAPTAHILRSLLPTLTASNFVDRLFEPHNPPCPPVASLALLVTVASSIPDIWITTKRPLDPSSGVSLLVNCLHPE